MEESQINRALASTRKAGLAIAVVFGVIVVSCLFNVVAYCLAAASNVSQGDMASVALYVPGLCEWTSFLIASGVCLSAAVGVCRGVPLFNRRVARRFAVASVLLWTYVLIDFAWIPFATHVGVLLDSELVSLAVVQNGLDAGFYFDIGAIFGAAALTLVASLIRYAVVLQQQADEIL